MNLFRDIERRIDDRLRKLFGSSDVAPKQGRELVEIQRLILDRIDERVQQLPRARRVFPYNEVIARIPVPDPERRIAFDTVFVADDALREAIVDHLRREEVEFPEDLRVEVTLVETAELTEPSIVCRSAERPLTATLSSVPVLATVRLTPVGGTPQESGGMRIQIGRHSEVLDERRRLVRRNDVTVDHDTVSRAHAHIEYASGEYRLFDDGSSYGTSVLHNGRLIEVPRSGGRGIRLQPGDEVYFGQARVRFDIVS
jgi:hypothetical protein